MVEKRIFFRTVSAQKNVH